MARVPAVVWWLLLVVVAGVASVPLSSAEREARSAEQRLSTVRDWDGTTQVVEGRFVRIGEVSEVLPGGYEATAYYEAEVPGQARPVTLGTAARQVDGRPRPADQPRTLQLRVQERVRPAADGSRYDVVQAGASLPSASALVDARADLATRATERADRVALVVRTLLGVLVLGCVVVTVLAMRGPGRWRRWAGGRVPVDSRPELAVRAAWSPELPVGMGVLTVVAFAVPLGWDGRPTALLTALVVLAASALLAREVDAVTRARRLRGVVRLVDHRRRTALLLRWSAVIGLLLGLGLTFLGGTVFLFGAGIDPAQAMLRRGAGVVVLSGLTLATVVLQRFQDSG